ncbi:hypothetical protein TNCT_370011 [Trichonephila clavata]|uniref:Uncharacterized protein n=1 Tax=Trichonephila clavata TaxID=2740835 RepID=A0A8X6HY24_TRICU|nr:hypothetical protein TNCT_370011 [Trichonephila clavata]
MLLRLNKYNIQLEYVPGKNLVIADGLSRAQSTTENFDEILGLEATVRINLLTQASPTKWEEIARMTTVGPQSRLYIIKREDGGIARRNRFHIRQDYIKNDNPRWPRTVDLYNSDPNEISRIPNDSAESQINASPKTNTSSINQRLQVPIENYSEQSNPVVRKSSRNIVKPVRYRDN